MGDIAAQESVTSNRYTILGRLAGGGMADIFLARVISEGGVQRHVVLKRVLAERSLDPQFAKMFLDEARLAAQLQHPNIAQLHDIGRLAGSYFYTMEYVHGEDLRAILMHLHQHDRAFPINLALLIVTQTLAALRHAHTRLGADGRPLGVVHRDVTPSNVMVSYEGSVKLLDFGVAKAAQHTAESRSGTIKGKIAYLSPEQCQNGQVDARSDLFSLGIVMHEMLVLQRLYRRDTDFATMMAIVNEPPPPPSSIRPEISPDLDAIVLKALAKDPAQRFSSAGEMLEAIETVAAHERLVMSSTALGRFLGELVGARIEPWIELRANAEPTVITITGESVPEAVPMPGKSLLGRVPDIAAEAALQEQLAAAPALGRPAPRSDDELRSDGSRSTEIAHRREVAPSAPPASITPQSPVSGQITEAPAAPLRAPSGPIPKVVAQAPSGPLRVPPSGPIARPRLDHTPPPRPTTVPPRVAPRPPSIAPPATPEAVSRPPATPGAASRSSGPIPASSDPTAAPSAAIDPRSTASGPTPIPAAMIDPRTAASGPTPIPTAAIDPRMVASGPIRTPSASFAAAPPVVDPSMPHGPPTPAPFASVATPSHGTPIEHAAAVPFTPSHGMPVAPHASGPFASAPTPSHGSSIAVPPGSATPAHGIPIEARRDRGDPTAAVSPLAFDRPDDPEVLKRRAMIGGGIVLGVVVVVAIVVSRGSRKSEPEPPVVVRAPEITTPPADAAAEPVAIEAPPPVDAAPVTAPPDAPPLTTKQQLDQAIAASRWADGLAVCNAEPALALTDRARCAIIACQAKDQAAAATFYASSAKIARTTRKVIEKVCREQGIPLGQRRPARDPCEANPLTCRK